ncbi:MAG TPA: hypothetical protein VFT04_08930, partial [Gemmatimonadales bacterium]|nr:hypothetical protein [Gemmatimonadales bacterium]
MSNRIGRPMLVMALALLAACAGEQPTEPGAMEAARGGNPGGNATPLTAAPGSLSFLIPSSTSATVTARVQFVGVITAATSDADCATVSPLSLPATKPAGSSVYVATFTITAVEQGNCVITLTDKRGGTASVTVQVRELPPVDGTRLLYSFSDADFESNVHSSNPDGSGAGQVIAGDGVERMAVYTPDRSKIVYVSDEAGSLNLFRANADGTGKEQLTFYDLGTHVGAGTLTPAVSPDGQQIAFVLSTGFSGQPIHIYVMDAAPGATPVAITAGNSRNLDPTYTPDGRIVFSSGSLDAGELDDGVVNHSIHVMAANGANLTRLTVYDVDTHHNPAVSADGATIAFTSTSFGAAASGLFLVDIDGQNQRRLTTSDSDASPVFAPNGEWLAFTRFHELHADLMVLKLGRPESEVLNLTNTEADEF